MKTIARFFTALAVIAFVVSPAFAWADDVYTDNLVIVMDDSGSMSGNFSSTSRMEAAKDALRTVLATVPRTTSVGLIALNTGWRYDLGPRDDARLTAAINALGPTGGTPLGEYIKRGADRLLAQREVQHGYGSYRLLVLTDGEAGDAGLMNRYAPEVVARGIILDVIGVGMDTAHSLARTAHSYRAANDPIALKRALSEVLAEIDTGKSSSLGVSAFEEIAGIPEAVATVAIQALSASGNYPIGEKPNIPPPTVPQTSSGGSGAGGSADCNGGNGCNHAPAIVFVSLYFLRPKRKRRSN